MSDTSSEAPAAAAAVPSPDAAPAKQATPNNDRRWVKLGVGAAIGSAAIAAALLYANRPSRKDHS